MADTPQSTLVETTPVVDTSYWLGFSPTGVFSKVTGLGIKNYLSSFFANNNLVVHNSGNEPINGEKTFTSYPIVPDHVYGGDWNGSVQVPTKNAVYDKIESVNSSALQKSSNLSDLTNTTTARTNLGLGSLATQNGTFSGTSSGTNTGDQTSTAGLASSTNKNLVTDVQLAVIGNTSGTNTGDNSTNSQYASLLTGGASFTPARSGGVTTSAFVVNDAKWKQIGKLTTVNAWVDITPSANGTSIQLTGPAYSTGFTALSIWVGGGVNVGKQGYLNSTSYSIEYPFTSGVTVGIMYSVTFIAP